MHGSGYIYGYQYRVWMGYRVSEHQYRVLNKAAVKGNLIADTGAELDLQNPDY